MVSWLKLDVEVENAHADAVGDLLLGLGASSATVTSAADSATAVLEPDPGATPLWQVCRLSALLPLDADLQQIQAELAKYAARVLDTGFLEDENWLGRWRAHAVHECFGGRLWVLPRDAQPVAEPCVRLDPGLAFGTGAHPTTRLCLEALASRDLRDLAVLDYGCGSGVLGLAACALGARSVVAVDHDAQARQAAAENAKFNGFAARFTVGDAAASVGRTFDLVIANILARPLIDLAPELRAALGAGGSLVLSGLLAEQAEAVMAAYPDIEFAQPCCDGEWVCLAGRREAE